MRKIRVLHVSDNHGGFPALRDRDSVDLIVHTGDLMPNQSFGIKPLEENFQARWLEANEERFRKWLGDKPTILVPGNHDYVRATQFLRMDNLTWVVDGGIDFGDFRFWGYPWTPEFCGWNWMLGPEERRAKLAPAAALMDEGKIDVFCSHGPMHGVLDRTFDGVRAGSRVLREVMQAAKVPPKALLCGHIHEAAGLQAWSNGMLVSNAGATQRIITLEKS